MENSFQAYISFLIRHKLTPDQYILLWLLHTGDLATMYQYINEGKSVQPDGINVFSTDQIDDLEKRGLIVLMDPSEKHNPTYYNVIDELVNELFPDRSFGHGEEIWHMYPNTIISGSRNVPSKLTSKDKFLNDYYALIGHSKGRHEQVKRSLEYAIQKGKITMSLVHWFESRYWEQLAKERIRQNE